MGCFLLTHVNCAVIAHKDRNDAHHPNQRRKADIRPACSRGELQDRVVHIASGSHDPERNDDCEQTGQVQDQQRTLDKWQTDCQESIEDACKHDDCNREKSRMPRLVGVCVWVVQRNEALNYATNHETDTGQVDCDDF